MTDYEIIKDRGFVRIVVGISTALRGAAEMLDAMADKEIERIDAEEKARSESSLAPQRGRRRRNSIVDP